MIKRNEGIMENDMRYNKVCYCFILEKDLFILAMEKMGEVI